MRIFIGVILSLIPGVLPIILGDWNFWDSWQWWVIAIPIWLLAVCVLQYEIKE